MKLSTLKAEIIFIEVWKAVFVWILQEADTKIKLDTQETLGTDKMEEEKERRRMVQALGKETDRTRMALGS